MKLQEYNKHTSSVTLSDIDGTRRAAVTLTFDLLTPKSNQHIYEPKYICDQNWVIFPSLVFQIWCSQGFQDAQTHAHMDGQTRIQNASIRNLLETCPSCSIQHLNASTTAGMVMEALCWVGRASINLASQKFVNSASKLPGQILPNLHNLCSWGQR